MSAHLSPDGSALHSVILNYCVAQSVVVAVFRMAIYDGHCYLKNSPAFCVNSRHGVEWTGDNDNACIMG